MCVSTSAENGTGHDGCDSFAVALSSPVSPRKSRLDESCSHYYSGCSYGYTRHQTPEIPPHFLANFTHVVTSAGLRTQRSLYTGFSSGKAPDMCRSQTEVGSSPSLAFWTIYSTCIFLDKTSRLTLRPTQLSHGPVHNHSAVSLNKPIASSGASSLRTAI